MKTFINKIHNIDFDSKLIDSTVEESCVSITGVISIQPVNPMYYLKKRQQYFTTVLVVLNQIKYVMRVFLCLRRHKQKFRSAREILPSGKRCFKVGSRADWSEFIQLTQRSLGIRGDWGKRCPCRPEAGLKSHEYSANICKFWSELRRFI